MAFRLFSYATETHKLKLKKEFQSVSQGEKMQTGHNRKRPHHPKVQHVKAEFTVAVRYRDGRRELFRVRNAVDQDDARAVVLAELGEVVALLIAPRQ